MYMFHLCGHHQRIKFNLEPNRKCVVKLSENTEPFESKDWWNVTFIVYIPVFFLHNPKMATNARKA